MLGVWTNAPSLLEISFLARRSRRRRPGVKDQLKERRKRELVERTRPFNALAIISFKPVLNWGNGCSPNILRTLRRTMIRFLIELLVRRTWFGQSKLYFVLNWLVMRCKLRPELAADAQQTA